MYTHSVRRPVRVSPPAAGWSLLGTALVIVNEGRVWVSITAIALASVDVLLGVIPAFGEIGDVNHELASAHVSAGVGLIVSSLCTLGALAASIIAISTRRWKQ